MIFQDPISSLNPAGRSSTSSRSRSHLEDRHQGGAAQDLPATARPCRHRPVRHGGRRPHQFSGGQCQRITIARARCSSRSCSSATRRPALDVSVQAQILNLLAGHEAGVRPDLLFISHDLAVVKNVSDRVAVMYLGACARSPPPTCSTRRRRTPTRGVARLGGQPVPRRPPRSAALTGETPSPINPPSGCRFRTRCPRAEARCAEEVPEMREIAPGHQVACHFPIGGSTAPSGADRVTAPSSPSPPAPGSDLTTIGRCFAAR